MATTSAASLATILAAARSGRIGARSARQWAARAAAGEDVSVLAALTPGGPGLAAAELTRLASDVAEILGSAAGGARTRVSAADDGISDSEADGLWPARTQTEADRRHQIVAAAAAGVADLSSEELHDLLFSHVRVPEPASAHAAAPPGGHQAFVGSHSHAHSDYQQGDGGPGTHSHAHAHHGDSSHAPSDFHPHPAG